MKTLLTETNTKPITVTEATCKWTRMKKTKKGEEKSVIDYILMTEKVAKTAANTETDETGTLKIKGTTESDHNTLTTTVKTRWEIKTEKRKYWNTKNKEGWKEYNKQMQMENRKNPHLTYDELEIRINKTLKKTLGTITITKGKPRNIDTKKVKTLRTEKRKKRYTYKLAREGKKEQETKAALDQYVKAAIKLSKEIESNNEVHTNKSLESLYNNSKGQRNNAIWEMRRKMAQKDTVNSNTITEEGETLRGEKRTKEHVASYYENLYQAREGTEEYDEWTRKIKDKVEEITRRAEKSPDEPPITTKELKKVIKKLKRNKATGPDNIPNEIFIEALEETQKIYKVTINEIIEQVLIPHQWQLGEIMRLHKGKKGSIKGKCSNERGITLSSNFGKVLERLVNNRAEKVITMTDAQAGGRKGRSTSDHIMVLREMIKTAQNRRKPIHLVFLDVTKAYDKAWLAAIMYVLEKNGVKGKLWLLIKKLNENLLAQVRTIYGKTRKITIRDSIRQGGVLAPLMYALLMDEINKEIVDKKLGIVMKTAAQVIGCLLWMDDVVLASEDKEDMQQMLDITNEITKRYHIEFGEDKTKAMTIGMKKESIKPEFHIYRKHEH